MESTATLVEQYASLLARPDVVQTRNLPEVLTAVEPAIEEPDEPWRDAFRTRYINLDLSEALYEAWRSSTPPFEV